MIKDNLEKKEKYIYNKKQALFFIHNGGDLCDIGENDKTGNTNFVFTNNDKLQELYELWKQRPYDKNR